MKRALLWAAKSILLASVTALFGTSGQCADSLVENQPGLVGYWKLQGDCRDYSGQNNHGINHGVNLQNSAFDGTSAYIEVPSSPSLKFGTGDFSLSAWVYTEKDLDDVIGDVLDLYSPSLRQGITLSMYSSGSGYQGPGNDRHVCFGIDHARLSDWEDCGRPSPTSRYINNSMLVYKGKLYAAIQDAKDEKDWCHVFRYDGKQKWFDCGRVGTGKTRGVGPLVVHNGDLYAVTSTYDWTRVNKPGYEPSRVYRYLAGTKWQDCGQPSDENRTLNSAASFKGKLYVGGGPANWAVFVQDGDNHWKPSHVFEKSGDRMLFPHPMGRYNGKLYTGWPCVFSFDGNEWTYAGLPAPLHTVPFLQTHSFAVYQGRLHAGTWPEARVGRYLGGEEWEQIGRVGEDGTEVNALTVYNGKLYGGSIPRAEVCRYDGEPRWTSLKRFCSPDGWQPGLPGKASSKEVKEWSRVTSLAIHDGKLFAGIGNCTSAAQDTPADSINALGKVFCLEAGKCVSYDNDLGAGWKHLVAVREHDRLKLYVDGKLAAESSSFKPDDYDVSIDQPLRIGFGQTDYFCGKICQVRVYNEALTTSRVRKLFRQVRTELSSAKTR